jgi:hypothetical protein
MSGGRLSMMKLANDFVLPTSVPSPFQSKALTVTPWSPNAMPDLLNWSLSQRLKPSLLKTLVVSPLTSSAACQSMSLTMGTKSELPRAYRER